MQDETPPLVEASVPGPLDLEVVAEASRWRARSFLSPRGVGPVLGSFPLNDSEARVLEPLLLIKYIIGSNVRAWARLRCTLERRGRRRPN